MSEGGRVVFASDDEILRHQSLLQQAFPLVRPTIDFWYYLCDLFTLLFLRSLFLSTSSFRAKLFSELSCSSKGLLTRLYLTTRWRNAKNIKDVALLMPSQVRRELLTHSLFLLLHLISGVVFSDGRLLLWRSSTTKLPSV